MSDPNKKKEEQEEDALSKLKEQLKKRGADGISGLARSFRVNDKDNSKHLDLDEFKGAIKLCKLEFCEAEIKNLFKHFDVSGDGKISFDEFLRALRGTLNLRRKTLVHRAFKIMDKDGSGEITILDLKGVYSAKKHPKVISGEITEDQALTTFLETFEVYGEKDGKVTMDEWEKYYADVSAGVDTDEQFAGIMEAVWGLKDSGGIDSRIVDKIEQSIRDKVWQKSAPGGSDAKALIKAFKYIDMGNKGTVVLTDFKRALERFGIVVKDEEMKGLFDRYNIDGKDVIDYESFSNTLFDDSALPASKSTKASSSAPTSSAPPPPKPNANTQAEQPSFRPSTARGASRPKDSVVLG